MSGTLNPFTWLAWSGATVFLVVSTRNPLYLLLALTATTMVYLSIEQPTQSGFAWRVVLRIALIVSAVSVLFNLLTVRAGDRVLFSLPENWPIVGGAATLNALIYGVASATALLSLIVVAATFSSAVDRAALLRIVPSSLASVGVAAIVGLSFFPQTLRAIQDVRAAQNARGFRIQSVQDLRPLVVPVLHLGLERAFSLAEAMESRGFGASQPVRHHPGWLMAALLALATLALGLFTLGYGWAAGFVAGLSLALLVALRHRRHRQTRLRGRYRPLTWTSHDVAVMTASCVAASIIAWSLSRSPSPLEWSPYPVIDWPGFTLGPGLAALLLIAPLFVQGQRASS